MPTDTCTELLRHASLRLVHDLFGITTHNFWIYWVTTISLTLLTMLFVGLWIVVQSRRNERLPKEAKQTVGGSELDAESIVIFVSTYGERNLKKGWTWAFWELRRRIFGCRENGSSYTDSGSSWAGV
jgi:hypothetical protein